MAPPFTSAGSRTRAASWTSCVKPPAHPAVRRDDEEVTIKRLVLVLTGLAVAGLAGTLTFLRWDKPITYCPSFRAWQPLRHWESPYGPLYLMEIPSR